MICRALVTRLVTYRACGNCDSQAVWGQGTPSVCLGLQTPLLWGRIAQWISNTESTQTPKVGCVDFPPKPVLQTHITSGDSPAMSNLPCPAQVHIHYSCWRREDSSHEFALLCEHSKVTKACGLDERMTWKQKHFKKKRCLLAEKLQGSHSSKESIH